MKAWVARVEGPNQTGWFGNVFDSFIHAFRWAQANPGAWVVEIELPDPPHEWKVGDWFQEVGRPPLRIADIDSHGVMVVHGRWDHRCGALVVDQDHMLSTGATPCRAPAWFTEGGAS